MLNLLHGDGYRWRVTGSAAVRNPVSGFRIAHHFIERAVRLCLFVGAKLQYYVFQLTLEAVFAHVDESPDDQRRYWADNWNGYPAARARLVDFLAERKIRNPVVLSGDIHAFLVNDVVAQQAEEWLPAFRRVGREIAVDPSPGLLAIASPGGLAQVLATLLDNSLTHGAGRVDIRCRREESFAVIEVADHGDGIATDLVPRIFERAVSGAASTGLANPRLA